MEYQILLRISGSFYVTTEYTRKTSFMTIRTHSVTNSRYKHCSLNKLQEKGHLEPFTLILPSFSRFLPFLSLWYTNLHLVYSVYELRELSLSW